MGNSVVLSLSTKVYKNKNIISNQIDGETVIMRIEENDYFQLDETGTYIWNIIDKPISVIEISDKIIEHFGISREQSESDMLNFINELSRKKIVITGG